MLRVQVPRDGRMRRVLVAFGLFALVEFATWIAILLVAYDRGGAAMVGIASVAMLVPAILLVPLLSGFGDRMPRGRALSLSHAGVGVAAALTGVLLLVGAPWWSVLLGGALLAVVAGFVRPMHFSALPGLAVRPGDLVAANGLSSSVEGMAVFLGFLLGGVLTDTVGASGALFVGALLALLAAGLTSGLRTFGARPIVVRESGLHEFRGALEGFVALRGKWGAQALLVLFAITFLVTGANETLTVAFNSEVLGLDDSTAGLLAGAYGLGLAIGGLTQTGLAHRRRLAPVVLAGGLLFGVAELAVAFLGSLAPAFVMLVLAGLGVSLVLVSSRTLLQRGYGQARPCPGPRGAGGRPPDGAHARGSGRSDRRHRAGSATGVPALRPVHHRGRAALVPGDPLHGRLCPTSPARGRAVVRGALPRCAPRL